MKAYQQLTVWTSLRRHFVHWSGKPPVEMALHCLGAALAAFVLAGATAANTWLPLPICLGAALGLGLPSFSAYLGGCLGYAVFWGVGTAIEPVAAGLLVEAGLCIFSDPDARRNPWVYAGGVTAFVALVGFLFLLEQRFAPVMVWKCMVRLAVACGGSLCFLSVLEGERRLCCLAGLACLCAGACAVAPMELPLGLVMAAALSFSLLDTALALPGAVFCGLAIDISWGQGCATAVLALGALCGKHRLWPVRLGLWLAGILAGVLLTGSSSLMLASAILGGALGRVLPVHRLLDTGMAFHMEQNQRLLAAAGLLDQLRQCLEPSARVQADPETAAVFDQAAERVCRMCSLWDSCWNQNVQETVDSLNRAAPAMMTRGKALREDLPALFSNRCRHLEGFLTAVNRELDDLSCRRQCRSRVRESREILAHQYGVLARALGQEPVSQEPGCRFLPEVGFRSYGRREDTVSGDRGATFRVGNMFYLILCDGMGTGPGAAGEACAAIGILRTLLQAGAEPREALELLNGIYILRDDGGFATVDLVQADLSVGDGMLWKWGGAPSYLRGRDTLEKIGTASPPPGIGTGEGYRPTGTKLPLSRGEMVVLTSDGAGGEAAERFLRQYGGQSPKELAAGVVNCSDTGTEDDATAAVLVLRPKTLG